MKTATLVDGRTIDYDHVKKLEETHPKRPDVVVAMYVFTRGRLGIVFSCPVRNVRTLE
jgi:hypothetical protein